MSEGAIEQVRERLEALYREESSRILDTLIRLLGDFDPSRALSVAVTLAAVWVPVPGRTAPPPGIVVAHSPASTGQYLGSPSLVVLPDGALLAAHDLFGPGTTGDVLRVHRSTDRGVTWSQLSETRGFWSTLFLHRGALYLIGSRRQDGPAVIRRSTDGGRTWTEPMDDRTGLLAVGRYHGAPMPVVEHRGRLWRAMEDTDGPGGWGSNFRSFMLSIPVEADLLDARAWTFSNRLGRDPSWRDGAFGGWLEGNAVVAPDGSLLNLLRADVRQEVEVAARITVSDDGQTVQFDPATGFLPFPGGCKKFAVRRDPRGGGYWSLSNWIPPSQRGGNVERTRNTLALLHSSDLERWVIRCVLLHHPDRERHGYQYADFQFDGADLLGLVRTAHDDETGGAHSAHDANYITFHRWPDFRALKMRDSKRWSGWVPAAGDLPAGATDE